MCGIVGYIGKREAAPVLLEGLRRLEYRGYDSAGMSVLNGRDLQTLKRQGKIEEGLAGLMKERTLVGVTGIGHTRWATHGPPSDRNSHPHTDGSGHLAIVHNGVIENFEDLRRRLAEAGCAFHSDTDSEVLAHLIGEEYQKLQAEPSTDGSRLTEAVATALRDVIGTYGIVVVSADEPGVMVGARRGSPLIIGIGKGENFLASDVTAMVAHTRRVVYLNDYDVVTVTADNFEVANLGAETARVQISEVEFSAEAADRRRFPHHMLKEIHEQPRTIENALRGRLSLDEATARFGGLNMSSAELRTVDKVVIAACGTSWHAGLVGEYLMEDFAHLPVEVEYASEFRYRNPPLDKHTLVLVITQSGETADSLAALREARRRGHKVLAICNVVGSTIAREADGGIYLHAGPEIGVASTKAFTSQVAVLTLFALFMGRLRMMSPSRGLEVIKALEGLAPKAEQLLRLDEQIRRIARKYVDCRDFFFLGRQLNFPLALEGALKLKEISYLHAEGYPAAEMKHGPLALLDEDTPCVIAIPKGTLYEKSMSNLEEVRARKAPVIALATEGDTGIAAKASDVIYVPSVPEYVFPLLGIIPLQLLAYHVAVFRSCDVDKPRNLAKSVTVE